ncbi:glutathione S-transferase family protein [Mariluticola halotolerans]|uniref:glutathione S-transferase family protein n=1 Tax=Mariluticola halotolerans TaxID=2909283 RepID=UPI0026E49662|nr:glutathione S-transferase family protein [Mariluticola halotolerans]UJQ94181.1 glutathione S-transferase family protein [Mariluticola halotolerans]
MTNKILFSKASPYAAKVRMAAALCGFAAEAVQTNTFEPTPEFLTTNPLGKVPVLITCDGLEIWDSKNIVQWLDRETGGLLFPREPSARLQAEQLEALADGIGDCLQSIMWELRYRPENLQHAPWIDWQWQKVERGLDRLIDLLADLPAGAHAGHLAMRAMLGYLAVRFAGKWEAGRQPLIDWQTRFDAAYPQFADLLPKS